MIIRCDVGNVYYWCDGGPIFMWWDPQFLSSENYVILGIDTCKPKWGDSD